LIVLAACAPAPAVCGCWRGGGRPARCPLGLGPAAANGCRGEAGQVVVLVPGGVVVTPGQFLGRGPARAGGGVRPWSSTTLTRTVDRGGYALACSRNEPGPYSGTGPSQRRKPGWTPASALAHGFTPTVTGGVAGGDSPTLHEAAGGTVDSPARKPVCGAPMAPLRSASAYRSVRSARVGVGNELSCRSGVRTRCC